MYERILVPVDGSATSRRGLAEAIRMARLAAGRIRVLHVWELPPMAVGTDTALLQGQDIEDIAREAGQRLLSHAADTVTRAGIAVEEQLVGPAAGALCEVVDRVARDWHAALIVLGSHGRRGLRRVLLGSDAEQILRVAPVPVLLVRDAP